MIDNLAEKRPDVGTINLQGGVQLFEELGERMLPELLEHPYQNRFQIAVALCFIDSRTLNPTLRSALGIPVKTKEADLEFELPDLATPDRNGWMLPQCLDSESYLRECYLARKGRISRNNSNLSFEFLGCLYGKRQNKIFALCTETTEFPNGKVFIEDVWYRPRSYKVIDAVNAMKGKSSSEIRRSLRRDYEELSEEELRGLEYRQHTVIWRNCGGVWQPTRGFNQSGGHEIEFELL